MDARSHELLTVIEHGSATVGFDQYLPVLEAAKSRLPADSLPTLLAERGFEHGELWRWLTKQILRSKIRNAQALSNLLMMIEIAEVLAKIVFCTSKVRLVGGRLVQ